MIFAPISGFLWLKKDAVQAGLVIYLLWLTEHIPIFSGFFEYETPKVVTVQNVPLGILRLLLQTAVIAFVVIYQLWYARGYQEFAEVEASVTTKVKGFSM